ncbi:MAG: 5'/3'-nucleotidase SurE [Opitutaceae bacterium]
MNLLVTNDDGIDTIFLHELVFALIGAGHEVNVVAPFTEQSWTGASKTRAKPVRSTVCDRGFGCPTWMVDGTPSDCVNIALAHLVTTQIDGVVSGINVGMNASLGFVLASGTIAGAWEGAIHGLPAVAFSQDVTEAVYNHHKETGRVEGELLATVKVSAAHAAKLAPKFLAATPLHSFTVHNVNFPATCRPDTPLRLTVPARLFVPGLFSPRDDDGTHRLIWRIGEDVSPPEPLTDRACLAAGLISHTILDYTKLGHA